MPKVKYTFSFTGATALIAETLVVAEEFDRLKDWKTVHSTILENNLLNKVKEATFEREFREIKKRLLLLTKEQMHVLINNDLDDAKAMILLSLVKAYPFLKEFIIEVVRYKYLLFDLILTEIDYNKFFNSKCLMQTELNQLTETTSKKVKQRIFTLLEQIGIITQVKNGIILKPVLSSRVLDVIYHDDPALLTVFLYSNEEIKSVLQKLKHA